MPNEMLLLSPSLIVGLGAIIVLLAGVTPFAGRQTIAYWLTVALLGLAFSASLALWGHTGSAMDTGLRIDTVSLGFDALASASALAVLVLARSYAPICEELTEAFCALLLFATLGMFILASSEDLLPAFLGLELVAVPLFGLIAWKPGHPGASESALKYAVLSGLAAAFYLYGLALIYGGAGTLRLDALAAGLHQARSLPILTLAGFAMLLVAIGFELAIVPFHMWTADIYQGAPVPVTALLGTVAKVAMLIFLVRILDTVPPRVFAILGPATTAFGVLGMIVGNLLALRQRNIMRLLGYSTIAQFGYILAALGCGSTIGYRAALYYGLAYAVMNMTVFGVLVMLDDGRVATAHASRYRGFGRRHPWHGFAFAIGVLSLAGVPPTAGFFAKLFVLSALLRAGHVAIGVVLVLATALSFYYYLHLLLECFLPSNASEPDSTAAYLSAGSAVSGIAATLTLVVGLGAGVVLGVL